MSDWAKKLFSEPQTLGIILTSGVIGLLAGVWQGTIQRRHGGWGGFFQGVVSGAIVAVLAGLAVQPFVESESLRLAIVGTLAVVSEDILAGFKTIGKSIRVDPFAVIFRVVDALRGRSPEQRASRPAGDSGHSAMGDQ